MVVSLFIFNFRKDGQGKIFFSEITDYWFNHIDPGPGIRKTNETLLLQN